MNLPVLFRTIDGTSQVTIETQYAARDFNVLPVWREPPSTFLFLQKDMNHWFALLLRSRAVRTFGAALREARRTTGDGLSSCTGA